MAVPVVSQNITQFIKSHSNIMIVSDIEGLTSKTQIEKIMNHLLNNTDGKNGIIYNGDILDYTVTLMLGKTVYQHIAGISNDNLCALKLLELLVNGMHNKHAICMIGNRDLNKIKMLALNQDQFSDGTKWWMDGTTILEIAKKLVEKTNDKGKYNAFWKITNMQPFNPFWAANRDALQENWFGEKPLIDQSPTNLTERFYIIFGADTAQGTISAQNNIACILRELGLETSIPDPDKKDDVAAVLKIIPEIAATPATPGKPATPVKPVFKNNNTDLAAAVVFTVFARLLDKELAEKYTTYKTEPKSDMWHGKFGNLDGYLYKYLTMAKCASYAEIDNKILLFAHGGISADFVKNDKDGINILDLQYNIESSGVFNQISDSPQSGGGNKIFKKIDNFCAAYTSVFNKVYEKNESSFDIVDGKIYPSKTLQILNSICTPADNHPSIKAAGYDTKLSPIQVVSPMAEDLMAACADGCNGKQIINIFSHIPQGIGYSFGSLTENMFFINTDFSVSFMKDRKLAMGIIGDQTTPTAEYDASYLFLYLQYSAYTGYKFVLDGTTTLYLKDFARKQTTMKDFIYNTATQIQQTDTKNKTFINYISFPNLPALPATITLTYDHTINFNNLHNDMLNCKEYNKQTPKQCITDNITPLTPEEIQEKLNLSTTYFYKSPLYHGIATINDKQYKILSLPINFNKYIGIFEYNSVKYNKGFFEEFQTATKNSRDFKPHPPVKSQSAGTYKHKKSLRHSKYKANKRLFKHKTKKNKKKTHNRK